LFGYKLKLGGKEIEMKEIEIEVNFEWKCVVLIAGIEKGMK